MSSKKILPPVFSYNTLILLIFKYLLFIVCAHKLPKFIQKSPLCLDLGGSEMSFVGLEGIF